MHKKPLYSFENGNSTGIYDVPLFSIVHIEDTTGLGDAEDNFNNKPALILILNKNGVVDNNTTLSDFIADKSNWMWFWNGSIMNEIQEIKDNYVKKIGDDMTGDLNMKGSASVKIEGGLDIRNYGQTNGGFKSYVENGHWKLEKGPGETNNLEIYLQDNGSGSSRVITTKTGVEHWEYANRTRSGVLRVSRVGNTLYMASNDSITLP
jgi:hypothetical protein